MQEKQMHQALKYNGDIRNENIFMIPRNSQMLNVLSSDLGAVDDSAHRAWSRQPLLFRSAIICHGPSFKLHASQPFLQAWASPPPKFLTFSRYMDFLRRYPSHSL